MKSLYLFSTLLLMVLTTSTQALPCKTVAAAVRSHEYPGIVAMDFANLYEQDLNLYWIDYSGKKVFYQKLKGKALTRQLTYPSHPWVVETSDGECVGVYYPDGQNRVVHLKP